MVPPCSWATQRATARPRPVPPVPSAEVPNRSKTRSDSRPAVPLVAHLEPPAVRRPGRGHGDDATGRAVPDRVVQQVDDELAQPGGVGGDGQPVRDPDVVRRGAAGQRDVGPRLGDQGGDVHLAEPQRR